jgi:SAM-dependent methyltransferase
MKSSPGKIALPAREKPNSEGLYEEVEYQEFWTGREKQSLNDLEHAIVRKLLPRRGRRLLDLGSGYGRLADCYIDRFEEIVMLDGSLTLLRSAQRAFGRKAIYVLGDIGRLPFGPAAFDAVVMIRVFQHLPAARFCLEEVQKISCGGGCLILSYSNKRNALRMAKFLTGSTPHNPFSLEQLAVEPNFIHHHPRFISRLLIEAGFKPSHYRGAGVFDKIAAFSPLAVNRIHCGTRLAPILGKSFMAPWIFCRGVSEKSQPLRAAKGLGDILICPVCLGGLVERTSGFACERCRREYPERDGIIDMRPGVASALKRSRLEQNVTGGQG